MKQRTQVTARSTVYYARYTRIIYCRPCCNLLINITFCATQQCGKVKFCYVMYVWFFLFQTSRPTQQANTKTNKHTEGQTGTEQTQANYTTQKYWNTQLSYYYSLSTEINLTRFLPGEVSKLGVLDSDNLSEVTKFGLQICTMYPRKLKTTRKKRSNAPEA